ncbi:MAG TPA: hypothetical protein VII61_08935 [Ktedonobacteraceae bacterium]
MMRRTRLLSFFMASMVLLSSAWLFQNSSTRAASALTTTIRLNGTGTGRVFDGIGAVSGGGGTTRLLYDYPAKQQSEILDYLFKPGYGANLQILKVEIGGDTNSTNGAEASSQRTPTDQNYNRGYEWWLMEQAKARNPNIKLYGLEWGAPGWFNGGFWSQDNINYLLNWIKHAQSDHGLHIDYIGGWNEENYNKTWFENLKKALNSNGLATKVVAADSDWTVATAMKGDAAFNNAVDIVGEHYPCGWLSSSITCNSTSNAQGLNKPLWASENGSQNYQSGAPAMARQLNRDYIDGRMTGSLNWSAIASWYSTLPFAGSGLMLADQPWSGHYALGASVWVTAQTTQFTQIGWQYINSASGYLGGNRANGSYVTLRSTNKKDYSTIIETTTAKSAQTANFTVAGGLSTGTVHVWTTNLKSSSESNYLVHQQDITPSNGSYTLTLQPGYVYSLTTTTGQGKGHTTPPASAGLALPYSDNFESYGTGKLARYFSDLQGAFETASCAGNRSGICLRQQITQAPIPWGSGSTVAPVTLMGDPGWTNYQANVDGLLEQAGSLDLIARASGPQQHVGGAPGYHLRISNTGRWSLFREDTNKVDTTLASGTISYGLNQWVTLGLKVQGSSIQALINKKVVATVSNTTYTRGQVGLMASKWVHAQFDNFSVV